MEYMGPARWRRRWEGTVTVEEAIRRLRLYPQSYQLIKRDSDCDTLIATLQNALRTAHLRT